MKRRDFLKQGTCTILKGAVIASPLFVKTAQAVPTLPVDELASRMTQADGEVYTKQGNTDYGRLMNFYNKRFECIKPEVLIYCNSVRGVSKSIRWCRENHIEFSIRSGGHCYEGLSRSNHAIIDVRGLNAIDFKPQEHLVQVGSGVSLGEIYRAVAPTGQAVPAGTCPRVGIAGHATAGGLGFLVRQFGLASDSLQSVEIVRASGEVDLASEQVNSDLFWALRGAGPGSFGIVTKMTFRTHAVPRAQSYAYQANVFKSRAASFLMSWQTWIETAPKEVSSNIFMQKQDNDEIFIQIRALGTGNDTVIRQGIGRVLAELDPGAELDVDQRNFMQAFEWFSAGEDFPPTYEKGKSDIVKKPMTQDGFLFLLDQLPVGVDVEITALGGAVNDLESSQTAFPHRRDSKLVIQWGISWENPDEASSSLEVINEFYAKMRPYMSQAAFLNYADRDVPDPPRAYWGANLERLIEIKQKYDPENLFRHALSVPLRLAEPQSLAPPDRLFCGEK